MLNKGLLMRKSKPIESSEKNAKLIKAFIYKQISEKNPQLNGMDKILMIKKMNEQDIISMIKNIPSLDDIEKNIQKHMEEKKNNNNNNCKNKFAREKMGKGTL